MTPEGIRSDLEALGLPRPGEPLETGWAERWFAGERLRQMGPSYARLALAGLALAEAARSVTRDDHRQMDGPHRCVHGEEWFDGCERCVNEVLVPALAAWDAEVAAVTAIDPALPWSASKAA